MAVKCRQCRNCISMDLVHSSVCSASFWYYWH